MAPKTPCIADVVIASPHHSVSREGALAPEVSSIEAWLGRPGNTWEYYRELDARGSTYRPDQDVSGWVRFNLVAYHQQAQAIRHRMERSAGSGWLLRTSPMLSASTSG